MGLIKALDHLRAAEPIDLHPPFGSLADLINIYVYRIVVQVVLGKHRHGFKDDGRAEGVCDVKNNGDQNDEEGSEKSLFDFTTRTMRNSVSGQIKINYLSSIFVTISQN